MSDECNKCSAKRNKHTKKRTKRKDKTEQKKNMLVPENQQRKHGHVVSMYLSTCGASGQLLGSDEKEIIYLVFGIIDLQNKEVSDQSTNYTKKLKKKKQYLDSKKIPIYVSCDVPIEKFLKNMFLAN